MQLDELIQADEARIDKAAVLQQIEQNLALHRLEGATFPSFQAEMPSLNTNGPLSIELLQQLDRLNTEASQLWLEPQLPPAKSVAGQLLNRLKRPFHLLIVFYVNKLAQQQNYINDQMRQIITQLIAELNEPDTPPDS
jgi:hypothetical protein